MWAVAELAVRALLIGGHAVVIDATNTTRHRRAGWLRTAHGLGVEAEGFVVDTALESRRTSGVGFSEVRIAPVLHP